MWWEILELKLERSKIREREPGKTRESRLTFSNERRTGYLRIKLE